MAAPGSSRLTGFSLMNRTLAGTARGGGGRGRAADDAIMINTYGEGRFVWDCTGGGGRGARPGRGRCHHDQHLWWAGWGGCTAGCANLHLRCLLTLS